MSHWTPDAITDQAGRTALVTGGNSGIGLETARVLAARGARIILAGRSEANLDKAVQQVLAVAPKAETGTLVVDLSDLASIREAASRIAETETIDLLFNNAGVMNLPTRQSTRDGFEMTFGTNHLGHFAFDAQLWPAVLRSPAPRVVTVSAIAARWPMGRLEDLMSEKSYRGMGAYAKSKRANIVYTLELARRTMRHAAQGAGGPPGGRDDQPSAARQRHPGQGVHPDCRALAHGFVRGRRVAVAVRRQHLRRGERAVHRPFGTRSDLRHTEAGQAPRGADDPQQGARLWAESERLTGVAFRP